jgi:urease accessory protein UreH
VVPWKVGCFRVSSGSLGVKLLASRPDVAEAYTLPELAPGLMQGEALDIHVEINSAAQSEMLEEA